jgi:uncharacterized SAM-binding protein YcdF (DUF218 family)
MLRWMERLLAAFGLLVTLCLLIAFVTYKTVPTANCDLAHFDTVLVLGCPTLVSGQASPEQRERVTEGVREFKAGRAEHMIFSGGPTENQFIEGQVMANLAEAQGVPASAIMVEGEARNTIQNIYFSDQIMRQNGWTSVEVVSSPSHLPRAGLILKHYDFQWKERASRWPPEYAWRKLSMIYASEITETCVRRWRGFPPSPFLPLRRAS